MEYRKAYPTDAYLLVQLKDRVWKNTYYDLLPSGILMKMKNSFEARVNHLHDQILENNRVIVALVEERIVGYIFYAKSQIDLYENSAEIREIVVLPEYQRKGIGKALYLRAREILEKLGYRSVVVCCPSIGTNQEFLLKLGGVLKETRAMEVSGYSVSCDIFLISFDSSSNEGVLEWNDLYAEVQKKIYLLNDKNLEIAAILSDQGNIYYGLGIGHWVCPIESALSNLYLHEEKKIAKILIINKNSKLVLPCGKCRDLLIRMGQQNALILFDIGTLKTISIKELNPYYKDIEKV